MVVDDTSPMLQAKYPSDQNIFFFQYCLDRNEPYLCHMFIFSSFRANRKKRCTVVSVTINKTHEKTPFYRLSFHASAVGHAPIS